MQIKQDYKPSGTFSLEAKAIAIIAVIIIGGFYLYQMVTP